MFPHQYILDANGQPAPEPDPIRWALWFNDSDRRIARDNLGARGMVSTVFLALDHGFFFEPDHRPVLWESMVFGGPLDQEQWRYTSRAEALEGHARLVALCKALSWHAVLFTTLLRWRDRAHSHLVRARIQLLLLISAVKKRGH
jgi:hypothetical protein